MVDKCPAQDTRFWKPGDIFELECPNCGASIEFFKDDNTRKCDGCGELFTNPEINPDCAKYCRYADQCTAIEKNRSKKK